MQSVHAHTNCKITIEDSSVSFIFRMDYLELGERIELFRKTASGMLLFLLLVSTLTVAFNIQPVKAASTSFSVVKTRILEPGDDLIHGFVYYEGYLWASTRTSPCRILKIDPETLDYERVILDAGLNDGEDLIAADGYIWVILYTSPSKIIRVDPGTLAWEVAVSFQSSELSNGGSLEYAFGYLWAGGRDRKIAKIDLSDLTYETYSYSTVVSDSQFHALTSGGGYIWGSCPHYSSWQGWYADTVVRINPSNPADYTSVYISTQMSDDMAYMGDYLYIGSEKSPSYVYKISDSLTYSSSKASDTPCYGIFAYNSRIWGAYVDSPGKIVELDSNLNIEAIHQLPLGFNDANEIAFDTAGNMYVTCWESPAKIVKFARPSASEFKANYSLSSPLIDGMMGSEWNDANSYDIDLVHYTLGGIPSIPSTVYFKHDGTNVYTGLKVFAGDHDFDQFIVYFDEGDDGHYGSGTKDGLLTPNQEDLKACFSPSISGFSKEDGCYKDGGWYGYWGGDFSAACAFSADHWECEFSIPFAGNDGGIDDVSDLVCTMADKIGIKIQYFTQPGANNYFYPAGSQYQIETYSVLSFETPLIGARVHGIDVRDDINWAQVYNADSRFAFVKATEGIDWSKPGFEKRAEDAQKAGLLVGVYHFGRPVPNKDKAREEAESFVRLAGDYVQEGYLRPALDVEDSDYYGEYPERLGKETLAQWIKTWMDTVEDMTGIEPILYMNGYLFQFLSDSLIADQYDIWIPDLRDAEPSHDDSPNTRGWKTWAFWQYKLNVVLAGGTADLDVFNGDISKLQTFVIGSGDHTPPQVDAFDVNPRSVTLGQSFTISCSVSDNVGLAWVELWRTVDSNGKPDGSKWEKLSTKYISGTSYSGSFTDSPSSQGGYWYGIHVGDTAGNWVTEKVRISVTVTPAPPNQPPVALFTYSPGSPVHSGDIVSFDASNSYDPEGGTISYEWDFGDGMTAEGKTVSHRFRGAQNEPKTYSMTLAVEDNYGAIATDTISVTVTPLRKLVDVGPGYFGVSCWMEATYNWVGTDDATGENLYIISKIETYSGGISGAYQLFILRRTSPPPSIPKLVWHIPLPTAPILRTYITPFTPSVWQKLWGEPAEITTLTFQEGTFQGIGVTDTSPMVIVATGTETGITLYYDAGITKFDPSSPVIHLKLEELKELWELRDIIDLLNKIIGIIGSPGELRIYDSEGHVTGLVNGEIKEEIPSSAYANGTILILFSNETYRYEVAGINEATYELLIISVEDVNATTFTATEIPTSSNAIHQYTIDWSVLSQGEEGVTVQIDSNGDGTFEKTFTAGSELTRDEFMPQVFPVEAFPMWIAGVAVAAIAIVTIAIAVFWRRRKQPSIKKIS